MPAESCYTARDMGSNGQLDYAASARLAHTLGKPVMTAAEREKQRAAYSAAVDGMAHTLRVTVAQTAALTSQLNAATQAQCVHEDRLSDCERALASRPASFLARLRWLLTGR